MWYTAIPVFTSVRDSALEVGLDIFQEVFKGLWHFFGFRLKEFLAMFRNPTVMTKCAQQIIINVNYNSGELVHD